MLLVRVLTRQPTPCDFQRPSQTLAVTVTVLLIEMQQSSVITGAVRSKAASNLRVKVMLASVSSIRLPAPSYGTTMATLKTWTESVKC